MRKVSFIAVIIVILIGMIQLSAHAEIDGSTKADTTTTPTTPTSTSTATATSTSTATATSTSTATATPTGTSTATATSTSTATATPTATATSEPTSKIYLPSVLFVPPPEWKPVADQQIPSDAAATFTKFFDVAVCGDHYFAGSNEGLYRLEADGQNQNWKKVAEVPNDLIVAGVAFRDDQCTEVYAAARGQGVWRGQYKGDKWEWKRAGAPGSVDAARYVLIANDKIFAAGDFGIQWANFPAGEAPFEWQPTNISSLVYSITDNDGRFLASVWGDGVYEWKQNQSWVKTPGDPADTQIYQGASNTVGIAAGSQSGLLFSAEGSGTWQRVPPPLPQETTYALLAHKGVIYAGQRGELAYKSEDGVSWTPLPGFPVRRPDGDEGFQVRGFEIGLTDGALYAATTSGVWRLVDSTFP